MKPMKKEKPKDRVSRLYAKHCSRIPVSIWQLGAIMKIGLDAAQEGRSDEEIGAKLRAYVETIREDKDGDDHDEAMTITAINA